VHLAGSGTWPDVQCGGVLTLPRREGWAERGILGGTGYACVDFGGVGWFWKAERVWVC
jgi:hypothetical protein